METKPINKSKKSNIYCDHCGNYIDPPKNVCEKGKCLLTGETKNYWNRCKKFIWREDKIYIE